MKKLIFVFLLIVTCAYSAKAEFIIHPYYINQMPQGCHHFFVVITYDNGDGLGEVYQSSGMVQVGDCPSKLTGDSDVIIAFEDIIETPEVNSQLQSYLASKGIDGSDLASVVDFSVFCEPESGLVIVSRSVNTVDNVEIRNLNGELLKTFPADQNLKTEVYNISDLAPGVYVVALGKNEIVVHTDQVARH